jgi:hypothetical protein
MSVTVSLDPGRHWCTAHFSGEITLGDMETAALQQIAADAWSHPTLYETSDASGIVVRATDVQQFVLFIERYVQALPNLGPLAIVAPNDLIYGTARMYQAVVEGRLHISIAVVRTPEEGEAFLRGVDAPTVGNAVPHEDADE